LAKNMTQSWTRRVKALDTASLAATGSGYVPRDPTAG
jgi:hypothetical protein